jgi:hypothetical protein
VTLTDGSVEYRGTTRQLLSVDQQAGQPQRIALWIEAQDDSRPCPPLLGGEVGILIFGNVRTGVDLEERD